MKVKELRQYLKSKGCRGYSTMKKADLQEQAQKFQEKEAKAEYERQLRENAVCRACLNQQRIQRKIDEKTFDKRLLEDTMRMLVCEYCKHPDLAVDGYDKICASCGALQSPSVDSGRRY